MLQIPSPPLLGQKALILGIANEYSIAAGCAALFARTRDTQQVTTRFDTVRARYQNLICFPV